MREGIGRQQERLREEERREDRRRRDTQEREEEPRDREMRNRDICMDVPRRRDLVGGVSPYWSSSQGLGQRPNRSRNRKPRHRQNIVRKEKSHKVEKKIR